MATHIEASKHVVVVGVSLGLGLGGLVIVAHKCKATGLSRLSRCCRWAREQIKHISAGLCRRYRLSLGRSRLRWGSLCSSDLALGLGRLPKLLLLFVTLGLAASVFAVVGVAVGIAFVAGIRIVVIVI